MRENHKIFQKEISWNFWIKPDLAQQILVWADSSEQ
jgi:hypothetical protein